MTAWTSSPIFGLRRPTSARGNGFVLENSDVVFTGGYHLFETKSRHHSNTHFYGCGVDVDHYGRARIAETAVPDVVVNLPRPVLGYFGVIDERIDYDLLKLMPGFSRRIGRDGGSVCQGRSPHVTQPA